MKKTRTTLAPSAILPNKGQLGWLPKNPRQWTQDDIDSTSRSIAEDPDFLEDRPVLVTPKDDGQYIAFAGNLRYTAAKSIALASVPVVIYVPETDEDRQTIKRRAMKDNGQYGKWDWDILGNEWDDQPLSDWGVPAWDTNKEETRVDLDGLFDPEKASPAGDKGITLLVNIPSQYEDNEQDIRDAISVTLENWKGCTVK